MKTQKKKALEAKGFKVGSAEEFLSPNHISVICKKEDFETSDYNNNTDCALAKALKREGYKLGYEDCSGAVSGTEVWFGPEIVNYAILEWEGVVHAHDNPKDLQVNLLLI